MGEEVADPERTIPRAIVLALSGAILVYVLVGITVTLTLGGAALTSPAPLADVIDAAGWSALTPIVRVAAATASLGALLALLTGIGRTSLAMAREGDIPRFFSVVDTRWHVPRRAELATGAVVVALILLTDLRGAIGFSSFGVLLYYLIANVAAFRQRAELRRYPRALQVLGAVGCVILAVTLPLAAALAGTVVVLVGVGYRVARLGYARKST